MLLDNIERVSPIMKVRIYDLDQCFSGYSKDIESNNEVSNEEKEYVEKSFNRIYNYVEKQYRKNERKLYCSIPKRILYTIQEILISWNVLKP